MSSTKSPTASPSPSLAPSITLPRRGEWYIDNSGDATQKPISSDIILIVVPFNASNRDHGAHVFESDCVTSFSSDDYFEVDTTTPISSQPDGFIQFNTTLKMNVTALNNTGYWNLYTNGTLGGWVEACVETYLNFNDPFYLGSEEKVDFKNNLLNISVLFSDNAGFIDNDGPSSADSIGSSSSERNVSGDSSSLPYLIFASTLLLLLFGFGFLSRKNMARNYTRFYSAEKSQFSQQTSYHGGEIENVSFPIHLSDSLYDETYYNIIQPGESWNDVIACKCFGLY